MAHVTTLTLPDFLAQVHRRVLGGDMFLNQFENLAFDNGSFPPYNVEKISDTEYRLTLAIAGFTKEEVQVNVLEGSLSIVGTKTPVENDTRVFIHRGIAERSFRRDFQLSEYVVVSGAEMKDGILVVDLVRVLPDIRKARTIEIH
jgi:molecular chaperone IbpA